MGRWQKATGNVAVGLVLLMGAVAPPAPAADFDGDGHADLAIGVRAEDVGALYNAGAVNVLYGSVAGITATGDQLFIQDDLAIDISEDNDEFGCALAAGDFDGDGAVDLAIGVRGEDLGNAIYGGAVHVLYGVHGNGLTATGNQFWHQGSPGIDGALEDEDQFGSALAAGDFNGDGYDDLVVASIEEDIGDTILGAGAVNVIYGGAGGLSAAGNQMWWEGENGFPGTPEDFDYLGYELAAGDFDGDGFDDIAVTILLQDVGAVPDAGAVVILYGTSGGLSAAGSQVLVQGVAGVPNTAEDDDRFGSSLASGDFNGDGYGDLGIAAVREDWGSVIDAGAVVVLLGSVDGLTADGSQIWVDSAYEEGDRYGVGLAAGDLDGNGYDELVVGIPGKEVGAVADGGALEILHGSPGGLYRPAAADIWHQDSTDVLDIAESSDGFGATLAIGDFDDDAFPDLAVGVPGEDVANISDAGAVQILYGSEAGVTAAGNQIWHQDSAGVDGSAEQDDRFGSVLEAVPRGRRVFANGFESGDTWWWSVTVN